MVKILFAILKRGEWRSEESMKMSPSKDESIKTLTIHNDMFGFIVVDLYLLDIEFCDIILLNILF